MGWEILQRVLETEFIHVGRDGFPSRANEFCIGNFGVVGDSFKIQNGCRLRGAIVAPNGGVSTDETVVNLVVPLTSIQAVTKSVNQVEGVAAQAWHVDQPSDFLI